MFPTVALNQDVFGLRFQNKALQLDLRLGALQLYRKHLVEQYSDRCAFWSLKDISAEQMSRTITIATDGADQEACLLFIFQIKVLSSLSVRIQYKVGNPVEPRGKVPSTTESQPSILLSGEQITSTKAQNSRGLVLRLHSAASHT